MEAPEFAVTLMPDVQDPTSPTSVSCGAPEGSDEGEAEAVDGNMVEMLAQIAGSLEFTDKELLRAVPAGRALHGFGRMFRRRGISPSRLYSTSARVERIEEFWSHSWRAPVYWKIWFFLMLKNGKAACIVGSIAAFFMAWLTYIEALPGWYMLPINTRPGFEIEHRHSPWCLTSGLAFAFLTLVFWQSSSPVFLDRACIHQGDPRLKTEGILNIAAFLKASKSLVVAFDETYLSRTWCVFEIAAFLKSHEGESPPPVVIKQIAVAPTIFYLVITVALVLLYTICLPAAGYLIYLQLAFMVAFAVTNHIMFLRMRRSTLQAEEDFKSFRWESCTCHCCSEGHDVDGVAIPCDKEVLAECITRWFGSVEAFENCVKRDVRTTFMRELHRQPIGYQWLLAASTFLLWGEADLALVRASSGDYHYTAFLAAYGLAWWTCVVPAQFAIFTAIVGWQDGGRLPILRGMIGISANVLDVLMPHIYQYVCWRLLLPNYVLAFMVILFGNCFAALAVIWLLQKPCHRKEQM